MANIIACSKCGAITQQTIKVAGNRCGRCGGIFVEIPVSDKDYEQNTHINDGLYNYHKCNLYLQYVFKTYVDTMGTLDRNCNAYKMFQNEINEVRGYILKDPPIVKCPTCGSANTKKITKSNKVGSAIAVGIFSIGHIGKTFHCNNCGMEW